MTSSDRRDERRRRAHPDDDPPIADESDAGSPENLPPENRSAENMAPDHESPDAQSNAGGSHEEDSWSVDDTGERRRHRDHDATGPIPWRDNWGRRIDPGTGRSFDRRETDRTMPRWTIPAITIFWLGFLLSMVARHVFHRLSGLLLLLLISVFLTFAIEPGVNRLARRGWRRGTATAAILLGVLVTFLVFVSAIGTLIGSQVADLLAESETYITDSVDWVNSTFGTQIDPRSVINEFTDPDGRVQEFIQAQGDEAVRLSVTVVGVIFQGLSVLLFTFYLVADGPRLRRAICSRLRPSRQEAVLRTWDIAINKTGGYLYSRALLALLSAISHWILFQSLGTQAPIALALWVGLFSQFLPVVGTYIAGILPILVTLIDSPVDAVAVLIFIVVYQQVENFFLTPRITSRTMELHPALAFGAAVGGAALLGAIGAILALPAVAMAQALATGWGQRYDVVDDPLTELVERKRPTLRYLRR